MRKRFQIRFTQKCICFHKKTGKKLFILKFALKSNVETLSIQRKVGFLKVDITSANRRLEILECCMLHGFIREGYKSRNDAMESTFPISKSFLVCAQTTEIL